MDNDNEKELFQIIWNTSYLDGTRKRKVAIFGSEEEVRKFEFPFALEDDLGEFDFESKEEMIAYLSYFKNDILYNASTGQRCKYSELERE